MPSKMFSNHNVYLYFQYLHSPNCALGKKTVGPEIHHVAAFPHFFRFKILVVCRTKKLVLICQETQAKMFTHALIIIKKKPY